MEEKSEHFSKKQKSDNNENTNINESSDIQIVEEDRNKNPKTKSMPRNGNEKARLKKNNAHKLNSEKLEIVQEEKSVKIKNIIDEEYMNRYDPQIQDNALNPKLKFFIDNESISESDKNLSSASLSSDSEENNIKSKNE